MSAELLPCPFCGQKPRRERGSNTCGSRRWWRVKCGTCAFVATHSDESRGDADKKWNRRTPTPEPTR